MDPALQNTLLIVAGVGGIAWLIKAFSGEKQEEDSEGRAPPTLASGAELIEDGEEDEDDGFVDDGVVAITSDGWAFVPSGNHVELIPPGDSEDLPPAAAAHGPANPKTGRQVTGWKPGEHLTQGDLVDARVRRGAPDHDPWRLEALGRDRDYRAWRFETESAAHAALALVESRVVRPPLDEYGDPIPVGAEDYMVAQRQAEATEAELANEPWDEKEEA
jgi:hypothetical protein